MRRGLTVAFLGQRPRDREAWHAPVVAGRPCVDAQEPAFLFEIVVDAPWAFVANEVSDKRGRLCFEQGRLVRDLEGKLEVMLVLDGLREDDRLYR